MDSYRETAFYLAVWYAFLAALGAILLIALNDVELPFGLLIAANSALLFALVLMALLGRLNDRNITRAQFWRALPSEMRTPSEGGRRMARRALEVTWLRFAKAAALIAVLLSGLAYASNGINATAWAKVARKPIVAQVGSREAAWTDYRSARVLPMN